MTATALVAPSGVVGGGFPAALFTIADDPGALRGSVGGYRAFATRAGAAADVLRATTVASWVGTEGDLFRTRRAQFEPMMTTARSTFTTFAGRVEDFASRLEQLTARMTQLRARAQTIWAQLHTAQAAQAAAGARLAAATAANVVAPASPVAAVNAGTAAKAAQEAFGAATAQLSALQSQWDETVRQAERLHAELAAAAQQTAAAIRALPAPPTAPSPAPGGATPASTDAMMCRPLADSTTEPRTTPPTTHSNGDTDADDEHGFLSSLGHTLTGLKDSAGAINPFATQTERDAASTKADHEFTAAGNDAQHALGRIGNGLTGAGQVIQAGAAKTGSLALSPFNESASQQLAKTANAAWTDGTARLEKDGLYTADVLSNLLPGGIAKGALVLGGKALLATGSKAALAEAGKIATAASGHIASAVGSKALKDAGKSASSARGLLRLPPRETWANPASLEDHFIRHGSDFGIASSDDYARAASEFLQNGAVAQLPTKISENGVIRMYDPATNTFGSFDPSGATKTLFKPTSAHYWQRQPGRSPW